MINTFTQEQANALARSYIEEISRLMEVKANKDLFILNLKQQLAALQKENEELKKQLQPVKLEKEKAN